MLYLRLNLDNVCPNESDKWYLFSDQNCIYAFPDINKEKPLFKLWFYLYSANIEDKILLTEFPKLMNILLFIIKRSKFTIKANVVMTDAVNLGATEFIFGGE